MEDIWRAIQAAFKAAALAASNLNAGGVTILVAYELEEEKFLIIKDLNCLDGHLKQTRRQALEPVIIEKLMSLQPIDWYIAVKSDLGLAETSTIDEEIAKEAEDAFYEELTV